MNMILFSLFVSSGAFAAEKTMTPPKNIVTDSKHQEQDIRQGDELTPISGIKKLPTHAETKKKTKSSR